MSEKVNEIEKKVIINQQLKEHLQLSQVLINYCLSCKDQTNQKQQDLCELLYNYYNIAKNHLEIDNKYFAELDNSTNSEIINHFELFVKDLKYFIDSYESGNFVLSPEIHKIISIQNEEHLMQHLKGSEVLSYTLA